MNSEVNIHKSSKVKFFEVARGVWGLKDYFVNIYMVLNPIDGTWVLIDAGLKTTASAIKKMAIQLFGEESKPSAILLTHGHFDHVGSLEILAKEWNVPVYAHYMEIPYLTGKSSYPPADSSTGGGLMSALSFAYPTSPVNIWNHINVLPEDNNVPFLPEWKYMHTPGHAPGHVSYFRESDGVLIAGDAFVTTKVESVWSVMFQSKKLSGPPKYFTYDWPSSRQSVKSLMKLEPSVAATGHGMPMYGKELRRSLHGLSEHFYEEAVPAFGRYIEDPAVADATGFVYIPPSKRNKRSLILKLLGITAVVSFSYVLFYKKLKELKNQKEILAYEIW